MSCNGCRVLRKGCSDTCVLRQCLRAIEGGEAQAHATAFVAKFFGRAAMMAFINAVPESQRAALFQSLLYEACGRTVNPVHGLLGLLCSGKWHVCQEAVRSVLRKGSLYPCPEGIAKAASDSNLSSSMLPFISFSHTPQPDRWETLASCRQKQGVGGVPDESVQAGSQSRSPSPKGSVICPLPMKRRCNLDAKEKQLAVDCESFSAGSSDQQQDRRINHPSFQHQQQQLMMMSKVMTDPLKYSEMFFPEQEQPTVKHQTWKKDPNLQNLELTLSTPPSLPLQPVILPPELARRSSNPSCISQESDGSVTSLDSAKASKRRCKNHQQILDLQI